ncbi:MAG: pyrroline-5-carboxylate reductase, partial [Hyphomicrobiales bacterium]|nr:pyrroline-5-carboxylate reductase [Hyphomicrobiales bacterium]
GGALLEGWLKLGIEGGAVTVVEPRPAPPLVALCGARGVALNPPSRSPASVLVLAVKPQALAEAAPGLQGLAGPDTLVVSIVAGKSVASLRAAFPAARAIVRAMPNTPAAIGRGATGLCAGPGVAEADRATVSALFEAVGVASWVADEDAIDAVTALSGSGPAYVFHMVEALAAAGVALGLAPETAAAFARATVEGAGALLAAEPATSPETLRRNVTSPGGTTAAALDVLMAPDGLCALMAKATAAAKRRAGELAG